MAREYVRVKDAAHSAVVGPQDHYWEDFESERHLDLPQRQSQQGLLLRLDLRLGLRLQDVVGVAETHVFKHHGHEAARDQQQLIGWGEEVMPGSHPYRRKVTDR